MLHIPVFGRWTINNKDEAQKRILKYFSSKIGDGLLTEPQYVIITDVKGKRKSTENNFRSEIIDYQLSIPKVMESNGK